MRGRLSGLTGTVIVFALSILPVFLLKIGERAMADRAFDRFQQRWEERNRPVMRRLQAQHSAEQRIEAELSRFWRQLLVLHSAASDRNRQRLLSEATLSRVVGNQLRRLPARSLIYLFTLDSASDSTVKGIRAPHLATAGLRLLEPFVTQLIRWQSGRRPGDDDLRALEGRTRALFGDILRFTMFTDDRAGHTIPVTFQGREYHLFWNVLRRRERTIGAFLAMVPRPLTPDPEPPLRALLASWKNRSMWPVFHRLVPLPGKARELHPPWVFQTPGIRAHRSEIEQIIRGLPSGIATASEHFLAYREPLGLDSPFFATLFSPRPRLRTSELPSIILLYQLSIGAAWILYFTHIFIFRAPPAVGILPLFALLLMLVAGLPTAGGLVLGLDHWRNLSEQWQRDRLDDLALPLADLEISAQNVTKRFANLGQELLGEYSRALEQASDTRALVPQALARVVSGFQNRGLPLTGVVFVGPGETCWKQFAPGTPRALETSMTSNFINFGLSCLTELEPDRFRSDPRNGMYEMTRQVLNNTRSNINDNKQTTGMMFMIPSGKAEIIEGGSDQMYYLNMPIMKDRHAEQLAFILFQVTQPLLEYFRRQLPRIAQIAETRGARFALAQSTALGPRPVFPPPSDRFWEQPEGKWLRERFRSYPSQNGQTSGSFGPWVYSLVRSRHDASVLLGSIAPRGDLINLAETVRSGFLGGILLLVLLVALLGITLSRSLIVPIRKLESSMREVARGNLAVQLEIPGRDEPARLGSAFNEMIQGLRIRRNLGRFVSGSLDQMVGKGDATATGASEWKPGTVLVSDIRSFTTLSELHPPADVLAMLNRHLDAFSQVIPRHGGHIQQFIGDAIIAVFWQEDGSEDHRRRAVAAAIELRRTHEQTRKERRARSLFLYEIGIGISSGDLLSVILGATGKRLEHLVFGDPLATAERLESASRHGTATRIICSSEIRDGVPFLAFSPHPNVVGAWELSLLPTLPDPGSAETANVR